VLYQESQGLRTAVAGGVVLLPGNQVGFEVTGLRPQPTLVARPVIGFSSYLGGLGTDKGYAVAVDTAGDSYVTGETSSSDFPTLNGYQTGLAAAATSSSASWPPTAIPWCSPPTWAARATTRATASPWTPPAAPTSPAALQRLPDHGGRLPDLDGGRTSPS